MKRSKPIILNGVILPLESITYASIYLHVYQEFNEKKFKSDLAKYEAEENAAELKYKKAHAKWEENKKEYQKKTSNIFKEAFNVLSGRVPELEPEPMRYEYSPKYTVRPDINSSIYEQTKFQLILRAHSYGDKIDIDIDKEYVSCRRIISALYGNQNGQIY